MVSAPRPVSRRATLAVALTSPAWPALAGGTAVAAGGGTPFTVPAVQQWRARGGSLRLPGQVVLVAQGAAARQEAERLAVDLRRRTGHRAEAVSRSGAPLAGEIALRLDPSATDRHEGYVLDIGRGVEISAPRAVGLAHGARTLLDVVERRGVLPRGRAADWPLYPERSLMVDAGRKYFPLSWFKARVQEMADLKLNRLHLHLSDDQGFRVECRSFPGVHSRRHLTRDEVRELVDFAGERHVTVVPELDSPGHLRAALRAYPEHQLTSPVVGPAPSCLDYTLEPARAFITTILAEYLDLFPGPDFHLGGDEYLPAAQQSAYPQLTTYAVERFGPTATAKDGFLGYLNDLAELVRSHGKRPRVWNDAIGGGSATALDTDIAVEWWTDISPLSDLTGIPLPQELLDAGHRIVNCSFLPTYVHALDTPVPPRASARFMYEQWDTHRFHGAAYLDEQVGTPWHEVAPGDPGLLGAKLHLWNDNPRKFSRRQDARALRRRLPVLAQKTWGSPELAPTYADFRG